MKNDFKKDQVNLINEVWAKVPKIFRKIIIVVIIISSIVISLFKLIPNNEQVKNVNSTKFDINSETGDVHVTQNYYGKDNELKERINKIEKKIKSVIDSRELDAFITSIFKNQKVESIKHSQFDKIQIVKRNDKSAFVIIKLDEMPITETIELSWYIYDQPAASYSAFHNMVLFNWADDVSKLKTKNFTLRYVSSNPLNLPKLNFRKENEFLFVGNWIGFRLSDGTPFNIGDRNKLKPIKKSN